nr:hypothetical protein [Tanacetum cinerariifolium]
MSSFYGFICYGCGGPPDTPVCYLCTCEQCGNILIHGTCLKCNSGTGNSFTYDLIPESFNEVQIIHNPPPQSHFNIYLCQICESNSHYGYECSQRVSLVYEPEPYYTQNFSDNDYSHDLPGVTPLIDHHCCYNCGNSLNGFFCHQYTCNFCGNGAHVGYNCPAQVLSIQTLPSFPQQYPCCEDCGDLPEAYQCQPPQYTVNHPIFNAHNDLLNYQNKLMDQLTSMCNMVGQYIQRKEEEKRIEEDMCDVPFHDNSPPLDVSKDEFEDFFDSNDESTSTDDDSFFINNIEYVEASPSNSEHISSDVMEIVIPEVGGIDDDILLTIKDDILREKLLNINLLIANIEALNDNPTPSSDFMTKSSSTCLTSLLEETNTFDNSLPEIETFCFDMEEISSGSTTTHSDSSLYDSFIFDLSINPFSPADGVIFMSSPMNSLTSYLHQSMIVSSSRMNPTRGISLWMWWRILFHQENQDEALRKCIMSGPYKPTTVLVQVVEATYDSPAVPEHTTVETPMNMYPENKAHFLAEKEAIHLILTRIEDDIYSTVDACQTAQEMWQAIERHKGKERAKPITPPSETASEEDSDPEQAQRDKDMQKNLNKNVDMTPRFKNDNQSGQFGNQRTVIVVAARENVGSKVVQQSGIQCFNCKEYGHFAKECRKPKRYDWLADTDEEVDEQELEAHYSYMAKIHEVSTGDSGTDSELVEQVQNDAGYNVNANHLQHSEQSESVSNTCLVETDNSNVIPDSPDMCEDDIQNEKNDVDSDDERVALANLKLDVDENKKIQKQLKKANTTLAQELKECKTILAETSKSLGESISVRDSFLIALQTKRAKFEKYKAFNDRTVDYDKLERKLNEALGQLAHKDTVLREGLKTKAYELSVVKEKHDELMKQSLLTKSHYEGLVKQKTKVITDLKLMKKHDIEKMLSMKKQLNFLNEIVYKIIQSIQTIHMMAPTVPTHNGRPTFANPRYLKQAQSEIPFLYAFPYDQSTHANKLIPDGKETSS